MGRAWLPFATRRKLTTAVAMKVGVRFSELAPKPPRQALCAVGR